MCTSKVCPHCKETKPLTDFYNRRGVEGGSVYCKICTIVQTKARQQALKKKAVEYKGGKCQSCGYDRCLAALEFHHLDPAEKEFTLAHQKSSSFAEIKDELDKCVLLCANCHREAHNGVEVVWENNNSGAFIDNNVSLDSYQKVKPATKGSYPSDEELAKLVWEYPRSHLAKVYNVSDVALGKYLKRRGIEQPPRGYWTKINKTD